MDGKKFFREVKRITKETGKRKFKTLIKEIDGILYGYRHDLGNQWNAACYRRGAEILQVGCLESSAVEWKILSNHETVLQSGFALDGINIRSYAQIIAFAFLASVYRGKIA